MSSKRTVMLLDFLLNGAVGAEREALVGMYRTAFSETEEYRLLSRMLNDTLFTGDRGRELFTRGTDALERGMTQSGDYDNVMATMAYVLEKGNRLLEETNAYIHSLRMDPQALYMITKRDDESLKAFLATLVNVICYYVTVLYGPGYLAEFRFDPAQPGLDMLRTVNGSVSALINALRMAKKPCSWVITRQEYGGRNLVRYHGFGLKFNAVPPQQLESEYYARAPFLGYPRNGNVLCAGIGLMSNLSVANGSAVLYAGRSVQTHLDVRAFSQQPVDYDGLDILELIDRTLEHRICAVPPAEVVNALNRWFMNDTVVRRNSVRACPLCGNESGPCTTHFPISKPEYLLRPYTRPEDNG